MLDAMHHALYVAARDYLKPIGWRMPFPALCELRRESGLYGVVSSEGAAEFKAFGLPIGVDDENPDWELLTSPTHT